MSKARYLTLADKAIDACIAAIDVYNKPDFAYREEAFAILMLNAWELLLKARIVQENAGKIRSIEVWETRKRSDGSRTTRKYAKKNRSGNNMVIGLDKASSVVQGYAHNKIDTDCAANLELLKEIRDNAVHLLNEDPALSKRVQEVGSASLKNFMHAAQLWFDLDLSRYNFFLMPIAFHSPGDIVESVSASRSTATKKLLDHITESEATQTDGEYNITMNVSLNFVRGKDSGAIEVRQSNDPDAIPVKLSEEQLQSIFPWDYGKLVELLSARFSDFTTNTKFYGIKAELEKDERLCRTRYLDPVRKTGTPKRFYSQRILSEFDEHYTKR